MYLLLSLIFAFFFFAHRNIHKKWRKKRVDINGKLPTSDHRININYWGLRILFALSFMFFIFKYFSHD